MIPNTVVIATLIVAIRELFILLPKNMAKTEKGSKFIMSGVFILLFVISFALYKVIAQRGHVYSRHTVQECKVEDGAIR